MAFSSAGIPLRAQDISVPASRPATSEGVALSPVPKGAIVRVNLAKGVKIDKLKAGSEFDGTVSRPIYVVDRLVIAAGTPMHFVVNSVEKKPLPTRAFTDRLSEILSFGILKDRETILHLRSATLNPPGEKAVAVNVDVVHASEIVEIHAKGSEVSVGTTPVQEVASGIPAITKTETFKKKEKAWKHPALTLAFNQPMELPAEIPADGREVNAVWRPGRVSTLRAGTRARLTLVTKLDAAKNKVGDPFEARLEEPIIEKNEILLPQGTEFRGHVTHVKRATIGRQPASMQLTLDSVSVVAGHSVPISGALTAMQTDTYSRLKMNEEGGLKPGHPGLKEIGRDIALAWVPGKVFNDMYDSTLPLTANFGGLAIWGTMFIIHKGHDVYIPADTEIEMTFSRDYTIPAAATKTE